MSRLRTIHASAASRQGCGVLLLGAPGAGKSDMLLRLTQCGFDMVADDQVRLDGLWACAPAELAGVLEVRGLGLVRLPYVSAALVLAVDLTRGARLPEPESFPDLDLPLIHVDANAASAPLRVAMALDCLLGIVPMMAGAFA